jgi:hypothetical protein
VTRHRRGDEQPLGGDGEDHPPVEADARLGGGDLRAVVGGPAALVGASGGGRGADGVRHQLGAGAGGLRHDRGEDDLVGMQVRADGPGEGGGEHGEGLS